MRKQLKSGKNKEMKNNRNKKILNENIVTFYTKNG